MKLSEAIILGSANYPQGYGAGVPDSRCALEAAAEAVGGYRHGTGEFYAIINSTWPWANTQKAILPVPSSYPRGIRVVECIYLLNDCWQWTRPQIAAWVATIEPEAMGDRPTVGQQTLTLEIEVRGLVPQPQEAIPCSL